MHAHDKDSNNTLLSVDAVINKYPNIIIYIYIYIYMFIYICISKKYISRNHSLAHITEDYIIIISL